MQASESDEEQYTICFVHGSHDPQHLFGLGSGESIRPTPERAWIQPQLAHEVWRINSPAYIAEEDVALWVSVPF